MNNQIEKIMRLNDPNTEHLRRLDKKCASYIKRIFAVLLIIAFITGLIIASLVAEYYEEYSNNKIEINVFGIVFEVSEDNYFVSPFMIFSYIVIIFTAIITICSSILTIVFTNMEIKCRNLDNTYRTMMLTREIAMSTCTESPADTTPPSAAVVNQAKDSASQEADTTVKPKKSENGRIICPICNTRQQNDRTRCLSCGIIFDNTKN